MAATAIIYKSQVRELLIYVYLRTLKSFHDLCFCDTRDPRRADRT